MVETELDGEAVTLGLLREMRDLAEEMSRGNSDHANRFHDLLQRVSNPNLPSVATEMGFRVIALEPGTANHRRLIAVCSNATVAVAAWDCARQIFPDDRWIMTWGGMVHRDSKPLKFGE
jgi:hypothetical protein